ncbi:MAG TPA: indolepyruvate ferredoxin oxidoreductase family protein [Candidatus Dormibacteraeota bacterium]|nr:indolepyruvate ferredoxin oxidoreductase family protein [Candidatus Dormibacteraeota bacterium]
MTAPTGEFSLEAKYTQERGRVYLSGIQALVRLPLEQRRADLRRGLNTATFISGYRGSPLGGFDQTLERLSSLLKAHHVVFSSGLNEDLGATAVFGSQMAGLFPKPKYDGVLGMWYGKAPGVDRTGDLFKHANYAGVGKNGGVLALAGDDPVSKSSTLPSHSEVALYDAFMPTIFPGNVQEILDLGLHGFMLSRVSGLWVGVKIVTNVADEAGTAEVDPDRVTPIIPVVEVDGKPFQHQINVNLIPPYGLDMERTIHLARLELARRYAWENKLNRITVPTPNAWFGVVTSGKTYYDVRQAFAELGLDDEALRRYGIRILKIGMLSPMEPRIVREFSRGLHEIMVVEEKRSFIEMFCKDVLYGMAERPQVVGKFDEEDRPLISPLGELDSDLIARAIARRLARRMKIESAEAHISHLDELKRRPKPFTLARTAFFCSGCPHNRSTVVPQGSVAAAGIGCHGMAMGMDRGIIGVTHMGAEGAQWVGVAPFTETTHLFQNIGDGTFFHSGGLALNYAVASGVNITYKILYNGAVAMTGGQDAAGALPIPALSRRLEAEGVKKIIITSDDPAKYAGVPVAGNAEVWHRDRLLEAQSVLAAVRGVSVLIHDQHCAAEKRRLRKRGRMVDPQQRVFINERVCEGCGDCGKKSNCLSVQPVDTEFGRKTAIHQSSCNKDYSCLLGDCPSFLTVEPIGPAPRKERRLTPLDADLPEPALKVPSDGFALHMMGIGGTGVVTMNQILGTAALLDGRHVRGLDQTGLSQKGGPVVSDLKIASSPIERANKISTGAADLYLGFDLLVATDPGNLDKAESGRTIAVVSTSQIPTGQMVVDTAVHFPELSSMLMSIDRVTRKDPNVYLDAQAMAEGLFDDHMATNPIMLGAAYQAGALPIAAAAIERAIRINGVQVEMNLLAFRWGRMAVVDRARVEAAVKQATGRAVEQPRALSAEARALVDTVGASGELQRLLEIRVPELIAYQSAAYAREYVDFVRRVAAVEAERAPGRSGLGKAVAIHLYKLMAYKDEYEVARLHLDAAVQAQLRSKFGPKIRTYWHLHPPLLRALGLKKKLRLGAWFAPAFRMLRAMKGLRGTAFDVFGYAEVRRLERTLIGEYRQLLETVLVRLSPVTHDAAVTIAELPDEVRGYEQIKIDNVARFREKAEQLIAQLN